MEILLDTSLVVPANQMILFVALLSVFLLLGRQHLCICITFIFTFYWGFIFNKDVFIDRFGHVEIFMVLYLVGGGFMVLMMVISYFTRRD